MFSFFSKISLLKKLILVFLSSSFGCSLQSLDGAGGDRQPRESTSAPSFEGSRPPSDQNAKYGNLDCEMEARIIISSAELRDTVTDEIVRTLKPGEAVFVCGVTEGLFVYGYVEAGQPIDCPKIPDPNNRCHIGWSETELKLMIAG